MNRPSSHPRTWSDTQLTDAVKVSNSWRGVMRELGLNATSAGAIRFVRRHAAGLGLDTSHFRGKRRWSDAELRRAVSECHSWDEALQTLGLSAGSGGMRTHLRSHAIRLGLDFSHFDSLVPTAPAPRILEPDLEHLRETGASIAAAWFTLCGCNALFPIEPAVYDLVVSTPEGLRRVQVKQRRQPAGTVGRLPSAAARTPLGTWRRALLTIRTSSTISSSLMAISTCT